MRPRKWVLFVAIFCLTSIVALYQLKRHVERNRDLETLLIQSISPLVKGTIDVRKIRLGFLSAHLYGITITVPLHSFSVRIDHIKIGFSFNRLLNFRGDYSKAINKIILIKPELYFALAQDSAAGGPGGTGHQLAVPASVAIPEQLPVPYLIIKNGKIWFSDRMRDTTLIGEQLDGTLTDVSDFTEINLSGKSGSSVDNMQVNGKLSWNGGLHTISMRLQKAAITKPIALDNAVISSGILSGNMTFTFPDTLTLDRVSSSGKLTIEQGRAEIKQLTAPLDSVCLHVNAHGSQWYIDTLSGYYRSSCIAINGRCNLADTPYISFNFDCTHVNPDSLGTVLPEGLRRVVSGDGRLSGAIILPTINSPVKVHFTGGGFKVDKIDSVRFAGALTLTDSSKVAIDSLNVTDGAAVFQTSGIIIIDSVPSFNLHVNASADSIPYTNDVSGSLKVHGTINGSGDSIDYALKVHGKHITIQDVDIGDQVISLSGNKKKLKTVIESADGTNASILVESPFSENRTARLHCVLGISQIKSILKRNPVIPELDSAVLTVDAQGWIDAFEGNVVSVLRSPELKAHLNGTILKKKSVPGNYYWTLDDKNLTFKGKKIGLSAAGSFCGDSLSIDTITAADGVAGHASIYLRTQPATVDAAFQFKYTAQKLLSIIPDIPALQIHGNTFGQMRLTGTIEKPVFHSEIHVRELSGSSISNIQTDAIVNWKEGELTVLPVVLRKDSKVFAMFDTIKYGKSGFSFSGNFDDVDLHSLIGTMVPRDSKIYSKLSGSVQSTGRGFPILFTIQTSVVKYNKWEFDSISVDGSLNPGGISVKSAAVQDGSLHAVASGYCPWSVLDNNQSETDTLKARIDIKGDFLNYIENRVESPIGGSGSGTAKVAFYSTSAGIKFTEGKIEVPRGVLTVRPFVLSNIENFSFLMTIDSLANINTTMTGMVKHRFISIFSTHDIPDGFEPFTIGPFDFGMLQVKTPDHGIDMHLPGFMAIGETGDVEMAGKDQNKYFTMSGPIDKFKISGTMIFRNLEFTFPFLNTSEIPWDFDVFPYVTWDLDLKPGDRHMMYFWDLSGKRHRILRFLEGYLDPVSIVKVRGRDLDYSFRLYGLIRSFKGSLYYGRTFDRNFNVGLEFQPIQYKNNHGYDNLPIIWGSAEAMSDSSRVNRVKVTAMIHDPVSNAISERGRLAEGKSLNVTFQVSSNFSEQPAENEREFYRQAGLNFTTLGGAGELMTDFGEQYFHRYLLERWERRFAKVVGLDVINIESSITSNYFSKLYGRQFDDLVDQSDYLALANVGVTFGRYFFRDYLFLKARGGLIPMDTLLKPEYSIGMELQPNRYLLMDFNYGIHKGQNSLEQDPRMSMQLTLPMSRIRKLLKF